MDSHWYRSFSKLYECIWCKSTCQAVKWIGNPGKCFGCSSGKYRLLIGRVIWLRLM